MNKRPATRKRAQTVQGALFVPPGGFGPTTTTIDGGKGLKDLSDVVWDKVGLVKAAMTKTGPNGVSGVIWALGNYLQVCSLHHHVYR